MASCSILFGRVPSQSHQRSTPSNRSHKNRITSPLCNVPKTMSESPECKNFQSSNCNAIKRKPSPSQASGTINAAKEESKVEYLFQDHSALGRRIGKTLYYAGRLPSSPRPSFPLTVLAVNAFTNGTLGLELDTLEFLDLDMATEIGRNACVSPTVVMMALVYLDRLSKNNTTYLNTVRPSELFVVALLVASKFVQDDGEEYGFYFEDWGTPAGFDNQRLNKLEIKFLSALDWNLKVDLDEFYSTLADTERALSLQESRRRGWLTYTELHCLSDAFVNWESVWTILVTYTVQGVTFACIAYITLLATVVTSTILTPEIIYLSRNILMSTVSQQPFDSPLMSYCRNQPIITYFGNGSDSFESSSAPCTFVRNGNWCMSKGNDFNIDKNETKNQSMEPQVFDLPLSHVTSRPHVNPGNRHQNHFFSLT